MNQEACSQCGGSVRVVERENHFEIDCAKEPLHYSEHKRKPGASFLWSKEFHMREECAQLLLPEAV